MNETIKNILGRRSVRKYEQRQLKPEHLQAILEAATYAPSAVNAQDWHFLAIQNKEILTRLNDAVKGVYARSSEPKTRGRGLDPDYNFFFSAPTFVIVSYKKETRSTAPLADCAVALQNIFLAAYSLGIGSCWINALTRMGQETTVTKLLEEIGMPTGNRVYGCAALGYPQGPFPQPPERKTGVTAVLK